MSPASNDPAARYPVVPRTSVRFFPLHEVLLSADAYPRQDSPLPEPPTVWLAKGRASASYLTEAEQIRQVSFGHPVRRALFTLGRAAARSLLAEHLRLDPLRVPLVIAADGAPEVAGHDVEVSLSHTTAPNGQLLALAAVAEVPLGIDLEALKPRRADLYRFLLHPDEYPLLDALATDHDEPPEVAVVRLWAMKEATLKAVRTGFRLSPKKLRLRLAEGGAFAMVLGSRWRIVTTDVHGCVAALALPAEGQAVREVKGPGPRGARQG